MTFIPRYTDYPNHLTPLYAHISDADAVPATAILWETGVVAEWVSGIIMKWD